MRARTLSIRDVRAAGARVRLACTALLLAVAATAVARAADEPPAAPAPPAPRSADAAPDAAETSLEDALLAGGVRLLVEATVEHVDFDELKQNAIEKLDAKDETEYRRQMDQIFDDLESVGVADVLGIRRESSRADVIAVLKQTDKEEVRSAMRRVPDASIAALLQRKLREKGATSLSEAREYLQTELDAFVSSLSG